MTNGKEAAKSIIVNHLAWKRWLALSLMSMILLAGTGGVYYLYALGLLNIKDKDLHAITAFRPQDNSLVFDRHGKKIGELFSSYHVYAPMKSIPPTLVQAVLAIEDRDFYHHIGVDPKAMVRAAIDVARTRRFSQGASTITQQLVRNLALFREKTIHRKVKEIFLAMKLEEKMTKDKILELYLNALFLGNGSYGVGAAAFRYFGKSVGQLALHEQALIAGLFQSPSAFNPHRHPKRAKHRQRQVLIAMTRAGYLTVAEAKAAMRQKLNYSQYSPLNAQVAPYFIDYVQEQSAKILGKRIKSSGLRIYTSLDSELQAAAHESIQASHDFLEKTRSFLVKQSKASETTIEAALVATDPQTGEILAMVGGRDYEKSQFNRSTDAKRSPGSAIKPVVYSLALNHGYKWSDMLYVSPIAVKDYRPKNYSQKSFLTETTLLRAFFKSINTPTIDIGQKLGIDAILDHAQKLGIQTPLKKEIGTLLGGSEVSMMDMARVYSTIANQGKLVENIAITKITDRKGKTLYQAPSVDKRSSRPMSPQVAYLMQEGLRSVFKYGTAYNFRRHAPYAGGKTGTSNQSRDNWFCGISNKLSSLVWVGTESPDGFRHEVNAATVALPIWSQFMDRAKKIRELGSFHKPMGVTEVHVNARFGHRDEGGIPMYFLEGQEPEKQGSNLKVISQSGQFRSLFDR